MTRIQRAGLWAVGTAVLVLAWEAAARYVDASIILPGPSQTLEQFISSLGQAPFYRHLVTTFARALAGFAIAYLIGIAWGLASGLSVATDAVLRPALLVMRATPVIAVILLALIWFDSSFAPLFVTVLMVLPVVTESIAAGVGASAARLLEMALVFGVGRARVVRRIVIPALLPALSASAHAGLGMAFKVTVAAEVLVQPPWAIGGQMQEARFFLDTPRILALTVTVVLLSAFSELVLHLIEHVARITSGHLKSGDLRDASGPEPIPPGLTGLTGEAPFSSRPLVLEGLCVKRGGGPVIADLSLTVVPGTVTVIFGPSGCGKSTLIQTICGLLTPESGSVRPTGRETSVAFQEPRLLPGGSARENVRFVHNERYESAAKLLAACGLSGWQDTDTRQFSGGMEQRVNLARAFSVRRPVLLLDEPLQSLDLASTMQLAEQVRRLSTAEQRTTVAVTHDVTEALLLADTVLLLSARPASIVAQQRVELRSADRDPRSPAFQQAAAQLYSLLLVHSQA